MSLIHNQLVEQPLFLQAIVAFYVNGDGANRILDVPKDECPILTGMGASFHAASIAAMYLNSLGILARAVEAVDLLLYGKPLLQKNRLLIYISQSGSSGEVLPLLGALTEHSTLVAVTNDPKSPLARRAQVVLPILAGEETHIACKTYLNSLAILWLLARRLASVQDGSENEQMNRVIGCVDTCLQGMDNRLLCWLDKWQPEQDLLFLGHGSQGITARHCAMMISEWTKIPARYSSIGAFRHGLIETVRPGLKTVLFTSTRLGHESSIALAKELDRYEVDVLVVENGYVRTLDMELKEEQLLNEYLAPIVEVIPLQLFTEGLTLRLGIQEGFRFLTKIVTQV